MTCPKCGAFIGIYSCPNCSGIKTTTSNNTTTRAFKVNSYGHTALSSVDVPSH